MPFANNYPLQQRGGKQFRRSLKTSDRALAQRRLSALREACEAGRVSEKFTQEFWNGLEGREPFGVFPDVDDAPEIGLPVRHDSRGRAQAVEEERMDLPGLAQSEDQGRTRGNVSGYPSPDCPFDLDMAGGGRILREDP